MLCDDTGLRAATTAIWLRGMGHDVHILNEDAAAAEAEDTTAGTPRSGSSPAALAMIPASKAATLVTLGVILVDVNAAM